MARRRSQPAAGHPQWLGEGLSHVWARTPVSCASPWSDTAAQPLLVVSMQQAGQQRVGQCVCPEVTEKVCMAGMHGGAAPSSPSCLGFGF